MHRILFLFFAVAFGLAAIPAHAAADAMANDVAATSYFPVLPFDALPDAEPLLVPLASNHSIDGDHTGITNAVIAIHDFTRDAQGLLSTVSALAGSNNGTTIILAPQFLLDFDVNRFASRLPERGRMFARWPLGGWENGGDSVIQPPGKPVSSFTVVDLLILYLGDKQFFPDMKQITITGHGEGANFVQRYAAATRALDIPGMQLPPIRFLVANASSYLYFTERRPKVARAGFAAPDPASCPTFDGYPYGLDKLNDYARRVGATSIKLGYASRAVTYLVGEKVAMSDPMPDTGCAAMLEGSDRVTRAMNYNVYLYQTFGDAVAQKQKFLTIPKAAYDPGALFGSPCGMSTLFGDGSCATPTITTSGTPR